MKSFFVRLCQNLSRSTYSVLLILLLPTVIYASDPQLVPANGDPLGSIGARTPLILIHGLKSNPTVWNNFIEYFYLDRALYKNYKLYTFGYDTTVLDTNANEWALFDLGEDLKNDITNYYNSGEWGNRPVAILAHSMGGLIARSFMQRHWFNNGGPQCGEKVLGLITLGTPHHGTPVADIGNGISVGGLRWDGFDNHLFSLFSYNKGLRCINNYKDETIFNNNSCTTTDEFTRNGFYNKIIAYGGTTTDYDIIKSSNIFDIDGSLLNLFLASSRNKLFSVRDNIFNIVSYSNNDGIVPIQSALFDDWPIKDRRRSDADNCNHFELPQGGECQFSGISAYEKYKQDLLSLVPVITNSSYFTDINYFVGQTINNQFEITNKGPEPVTVANLTIGGRDPSGQVADFSSNTCVTLQPNIPYTFTGSLTVTKIGNYSFFPAYDTLVIGTTCPESKSLWNTDIPDESGNINNNIKTIAVSAAPLPSTPYNLELTTQTVPSRANMLPSSSFTQTWTLKNTGATTWGSDYKLEFVSGSDLMGGPISIPVPRSVAKGDSVAISVNLTTPAKEGTYSGYWRMRAPNGTLFGPQLSAIINISSISGDFKIHDWVSAYGYIRTRDNANLNANLSCEGGKGDDGNIIDGPVVASALSWWKIKWDSGACKGVIGWSAQRDLNGNTQFQKTAYPAEGNIIRHKGTISKYLYKNGRKWLFKDDNIFSKMGYSSADIKDIPSGMVGEFAYGLPPIIIDNGSIIRLKGDFKKYFIVTNQRRLITSDAAYYYYMYPQGFKLEDVIDVPQAIFDMFPPGTDISTSPKVLLSAPSGGSNYVVGDKISIIWTAIDDVGVSSVDISYSTNGGTNWNSIAAGVPNTTGNYLWTPNFFAPSVMIKVVAHNTSGFDSDPDTTKGTFSIQDVYRYADFTISSLATSSSSVTAGQQITVSTTVLNQGNGTSPSTNLKYYYSATSTGKDYFLGESSVPALTAGGPTSLSATVTIPTSNILQGYLVAIVNPDYYAAESTTANNIASSSISIIDNVPPTINSLAFGYNFYKTGAEYPIIFDVTDNIGVKSLGFYYSIDSGATWNTITDYFIPGSQGIQNSYKWTIPTTIVTPASLQIKMKAKDASGNVSEKSAGPYAVKDGTKPAVSILSPNGGEIFALGSTQTIKWNVNAPNGIGAMNLELLWGDSVTNISNITSNSSGSYSWPVPATSSFVSNTAKVRIKITDINGNQNEDMSDGFFTISDASTPPPSPWTTPQVITTVPSTNWPYTSKDHGKQVIATDSSGNVHLAYIYNQDDLSGIINYPPSSRVIKQEILYKKFDGTAWTSPIVVYSLAQNTDGNLNNYQYIDNLQIAVGNDNLPSLVWDGGISGSNTVNLNQTDIYYSHYNGSTWSPPLNLSNNISGAPNLTDVKWSAKSDMPGGKRNAASAVVNNKLYIFGGSQSLVNYQYDPASNTWTRISDSPSNGVDESGAAVINGKVYVVGDPASYKELKIYDPVNGSWSLGPAMSTPRRSPAVAAVNGKLYVIGGGDSSLNSFATVEEYDPILNKWTTKTSMPTSRVYAATAVVDNKIYVMGGLASGTSSGAVEMYDPLTDNWTAKRSMQRNYGALAAVVNNKIYVVGGFDGLVNNVEEYDPATNSWQNKAPMPTPRSFSAGGVIGNSIYVVGGSDGYNFDMTVNEQLTIGVGGSATISSVPKILIDGNQNTHVVWSDGSYLTSDSPYTSAGESGVFYRKTDNTGAWSDAIRLTSGYSFRPVISQDIDGNIYVAYENESSEVSYIIWNGTSWSDPQNTNHKLNGFLNFVAKAQNNIYMAWYYYDNMTNSQQILYSHYDGSSWIVPEKMPDLSADIYPYHPSLVVDSSNRPHIIFEDNNKGKLIYKYREINGWSAPVQLNLSSQYLEQGSSKIAISNDDHIQVVWQSRYNGHNEVFYNHASLQSGMNDRTSPSASILAPTEGASLSIGATHAVSWSATDNVGVTNISLDFTTDDGINFTPIAANLNNSGLYQWMIPNMTSSNVQIRITAQDVAGNKGYGLSGKFFVSDKTSPSVTLVSPKGGEVWPEGSIQSVQWTAADNLGITGIELYYSTDGMVSWYPIASSLAGTSYQWTVPAALSSNCVVKIAAKDASGNVGQNTGDWSFAIVSANKPPYQPNTPDPANSATGVIATKTLIWSSGDPDPGDTVTNDIYLGSCGSMALVSGGQTSTSYSPQTLGDGQINCWQVVAKDNHGNTTIGPVWTFTTESPALPVLSVSTGNMVFQSIMGESANSQSITIDNAGGGTLNWSTVSSSPWLNVTGASGTNSGAATISADTTGLAAGSYIATLTISSNEAANSPLNIPVTLLITDQTATDGVGVAQIPKTGQTTSYATGDDGDLQAGVAWPNPRFSDIGDGTVGDNLTGLIWAKDANAPGPTLCNPATTKTWYGALNYIACLNSNNYLGFNDWILPNINELKSLIDTQNVSPALPLGHPFTNIQSQYYYWTSNTYVAILERTRVVNMAYGFESNLFNKLDYCYVWPVRKGQWSSLTLAIPKSGQTYSYASDDDGALQRGVAWPESRFTDNSDGTVTDNLTGLIWLKNANCFNTIVWGDALASANTLAGGVCGLTDGSEAGAWRLPNRKELDSLVDNVRYNPALPAAYPFESVQSNYYWSSSSSAYGTDGVWVVDMYNGDVKNNNKANAYYVWPVRAGVVSLPLSYSLSVAQIGSGSITPSSGSLSWSGNAGTASYPAGSEVTLTASATTGSIFAGWSGACNGTGTCTVIMDVAKNVTATFSLLNTADTSPPTVTAFILPATSNSLTVEISNFTASDTVGVTGYCLVETDNSSGCTWSATAPTSHLFATAGSKSLYSFVKDLAGNISNSKSATTTITLPVLPDPPALVPKTGQTTSYAAGDDGDLKMGVAWPDPRFTDIGDGTVADNLTGLIWAMDASTPTVDACVGGTKTWQGALDYVDCLNNTAYLGHSDWLLPNINELKSLIDAQIYSIPAVSPFAGVQSGGYWSSSTYAGYTGGAWGIVMYNGYVDFDFKTDNYYAWPMRGGQSTLSLSLPRTGQTISYASDDDGALQRGMIDPAPRFTANNDGTVTDNRTGLIWLQNANCFWNKTWSAALSSANSLSSGACGLGDSSTAGDWRLPNRNELNSLIDYGMFYPAIPTAHPFTGVRAGDYWSSSTSVASTGNAWLVSIGGGGVGDVGKTYTNFYVWPVRGQSIPPLSSLLNVTQSGNGSVTPDVGILTWSGNAGTASYPVGAEVTLTASSTTGSTFVSWSGACSGTSSSCIVTMNAAQSVTASFDLDFDNDGMGNSADFDDDGDGISDLTEIANGTDPLNPDIVAPGIPVVSGDAFTNSKRPIWSWTSGGSGISTFRYHVGSNDFTVGAITTTSLSFTATSDLIDGSYPLYVQERDAAGNWSNSGSFTTVVDTVVPTLSVSTLDNQTTNNATLNVSGTASDNNQLAMVTVNGTATTVPSNNFSQAVTLSSGGNTIPIIATDTAGNSNTTTRTVTFDPDAPPLTVGTPADNIATSTAQTTITGTCGDAANVTVKVNNNTPQTAAITTGSYTLSVTLREGQNTLTVTATDTVGNNSSVARTITYDATAPTLAITIPVADITAHSMPYTISGTVFDALTDVSLTMTVNGQAVDPTINAADFSYQLQSLQGGAYQIVVTAKDQLENTATVTRNVIYVPYGDLDNDGVTTSADALPALQMAIGKKTVDLKADLAPLINGVPAPDGKVTAADALVILRKAVGLW